jgi:hypothetical protein
MTLWLASHAAKNFDRHSRRNLIEFSCSRKFPMNTTHQCFTRRPTKVTHLDEHGDKVLKRLHGQLGGWINQRDKGISLKNGGGPLGFGMAPFFQVGVPFSSGGSPFLWRMAPFWFFRVPIFDGAAPLPFSTAPLLCGAAPGRFFRALLFQETAPFFQFAAFLPSKRSFLGLFLPPASFQRTVRI